MRHMHVIAKSITPTAPKFKIAPEESWLEDYILLGSGNFQRWTAKLPGYMLNLNTLVD